MSLLGGPLGLCSIERAETEKVGAPGPVSQVMLLRFASDDQLVASVRRGDARAFEALYDRHSRGLLSFCMQMLASRDDAEDALQSTFAAAYRALSADERPVLARPWLYTIARNACLSILRRRRSFLEVESGLAGYDDPALHVEHRDELRELIVGLQALPEEQRAALVLAQLHGFSHGAIAELLGVRGEQVKAWVYQARSSLISDRQARDADCREIREELASARGAALLKGHLRRHLRACPGCRQYSEQLARQRYRLGALLPVPPSFALKRKVLHTAFARTPDTTVALAGAAAPAGVAGTELIAAGVKAMLVKLLIVAAGVGAGAAAGTALLGTPFVRSHAYTPVRLLAATSHRAPSASSPVHAPSGLPGVAPELAGRGTRMQPAGTQVARASAADQRHRELSAGDSKLAGSDGQRHQGDGKSGEAPGRSGEVHGEGGEGHGKSGEAHGRSGEAHGKSEQAHGKSGEAHGKGVEAHGKSEQAHGRGSAETGHGNGGAMSAGGHGGAGEVHGQDGEARGSSGEAGAKNEESHGKSNEPHGQSESAVAPTPPGGDETSAPSSPASSPGNSDHAGAPSGHGEAPPGSRGHGG